MKTYLFCMALFVSGVLFMRMISASPLQKPSQPASQQPMDKWEALDWSLKSSNPFPYKTIHPKDGFVPDEATAVRIGEAVAIAQYGEKQISKERPFEARLREGIWTVAGTLHPQGAFGGTAVVKLRKTTGEIVFMVHQE